jgi:branched-chain amino acid transport system substrate-binding protein
MKRPTALWVIVVALTVSTGGTVASAQQALKIGLILPLTGPFTSTGHQIEAAAKLYMQQNSDTIAGKKVQLLVKDDGGVADTTKRLAQELIVREKVAVLAGFGLTPLALATAPLARGRHGCRHIDHHRAIALYRPYELHGGTGHRSAG